MEPKENTKKQTNGAYPFDIRNTVQATKVKVYELMERGNKTSLILTCLVGCFAIGIYSYLALGVEDGLLSSENEIIVTRAKWGARGTETAECMGIPVTVVFVHHTAMTECFTQDACAAEMRNIQNLHMDVNGWDDIGYNFVIGEDGRAYEGRGWDRIGAHTKGWNNVAVSFSVMGDYTYKLPNDAALKALHSMIQRGIKLGKITPDYKLLGHRDARDTESPGQKLYELIQTWGHYDRNTVKPTPKPLHTTIC